MGKKKCGNYTRKGYFYNVYNVIASQIETILKEGNRLNSKIKEIKRIRRENDARLKRFERLRKALKSKEFEIIRRGLNDIKELKRVEEEKRKAINSSEILFDPITIFEQFFSEVPESQ